MFPVLVNFMICKGTSKTLQSALEYWQLGCQWSLSGLGAGLFGHVLLKLNWPNLQV